MAVSRPLVAAVGGRRFVLALGGAYVERHGGDVWVDSVPGEGSTFSVTLPADGTHDG